MGKALAVRALVLWTRGDEANDRGGLVDEIRRPLDGLLRSFSPDHQVRGSKSTGDVGNGVTADDVSELVCQTRSVGIVVLIAKSRNYLLEFLALGLVEHDGSFVDRVTVKDLVESRTQLVLATEGHQELVRDELVVYGTRPRWNGGALLRVELGELGEDDLDEAVSDVLRPKVSAMS